MNQEDLKNLMGWLQAIHKEAQTGRGTIGELKSKIDLLPEIRENVRRDEQRDSSYEHKLDDTRTRLENQLRKIEDMMNEMRSEMRELKSKIDHLK